MQILLIGFRKSQILLFWCENNAHFANLIRKNIEFCRSSEVKSQTSSINFIKIFIFVNQAKNKIANFIDHAKKNRPACNARLCIKESWNSLKSLDLWYFLILLYFHYKAIFSYFLEYIKFKYAAESGMPRTQRLHDGTQKKSFYSSCEMRYFTKKSQENSDFCLKIEK